VLKDSFSENFNEEVARNSLNFRWPQTLKFTEITALVPFSTPTRDFINYASPGHAVGVNEHERPSKTATTTFGNSVGLASTRIDGEEIALS
jgi:hypothetical protein